ncbi:MAG: hypothetical protein K5876_00690 [Ruminiclostridium sp.]|nr:hypothetical protein [Ruminiclostridium sp.]
MKINTEALIKTASAKLGMPEDKLREALRSGNTAEIKKYMSGAEGRKLDSALNDRGLAEEIRKKYGGR